MVLSETVRDLRNKAMMVANEAQVRKERGKGVPTRERLRLDHGTAQLAFFSNIGINQLRYGSKSLAWIGRTAGYPRHATAHGRACRHLSMSLRAFPTVHQTPARWQLEDSGALP